MTLIRRTFDSIRADLILDSSGELTLNGQPMILLPRHFFLCIMQEVEAVAGRDAFRKIYRKAGFDGAVTFCRRFREVHGCSPREAVEGYLEEMSLRGWGQYQIFLVDEERGCLEVLLHNSALRHARLRGPWHEVWVGAMEGAMMFLMESLGRPQALEGKEVTLRPEDPREACRIHVKPRRRGR